MVSSSLLLLVLGSTAFAADCFKDQRRTTKIPNSAQIRKALAPVLGNVCNRWRADDPDQKENTFNYASVLIQIKRTDKSVPLKNCPGALFQILEQCVEGNNYWGGDWSYGGEYYSIKNSIYPANPLLPKDDGGPGDLIMPGHECELNKDKASTFVDSGAAQYLEDFLKRRSDDDWLVAMHHATTGSDGQTAPACGIVPTSQCAPNQGCSAYTPAQFYYIRIVSRNINDFFFRALTELTDTTIINLLRIEQIIVDFRPDPQASINPNDLYAAAGAMGAAGAALSFIPGPYSAGLGAFFGIVSGLLNVAASAPPPEQITTVDELRLRAHNWLGNIFQSQRDGMHNLLARLFGVGKTGHNLDETIAQLEASGVQMIADDWSPIAKIFALGWMGQYNDAGWRQVFMKQMDLFNQGLVGVILKALSGKVAVFKDLDQNSCNLPGARWVDGECYMLTRGWDGNAGWKIMEEERMKKLEESYGFDLPEFYRNAKQCANGNSISDLKAMWEMGSNANYPACFFNLPFKSDGYYNCPATRCTNNADCNKDCFEHCDFPDSGIEGQSSLARGLCFPKSQ